MCSDVVKSNSPDLQRIGTSCWPREPTAHWICDDAASGRFDGSLGLPDRVTRKADDAAVRCRLGRMMRELRVEELFGGVSRTRAKSEEHLCSERFLLMHRATHASQKTGRGKHLSPSKIITCSKSLAIPPTSVRREAPYCLECSAKPLTAFPTQLYIELSVKTNIRLLALGRYTVGASLTSLKYPFSDARRLTISTSGSRPPTYLDKIPCSLFYGPTGVIKAQTETRQG
jgi:hypothetical protein